MTWYAGAARIVAVAGLGLAVADAADAASVWEQQSELVWQAQDRCAHDAFVKFPDYTKDGNERRAQAVVACERKSHVLPRPLENVSPVKRIPDSAAD